MPKRSPVHLLAPRYWLTWLGIALLWLLCRLPYRWLLAIGRGLGWLLLHCSQRARHTCQINLQLCFPEFSPAQQQHLLQQSFASIGMGIIESAFAWWKTPNKNWLHIQGLEHLQHCMAQNKSIILLGAHFTTLEIIGRLLLMHMPFAVVYRKQKNPVLEWLNQRMLRHYPRAIAREDVRGFIRCLRSKLPLWYTPDVDAGARNSLFVPFFSVPAATITSTSRLAKLTDAAVVPIAYYRRKDGKGYDLIFHPALENFPTDDLAADALRINQVIEMMIKQAPEQYLWQYKRFKTRPNSEKRLYSRKN